MADLKLDNFKASVKSLVDVLSDETVDKIALLAQGYANSAYELGFEDGKKLVKTPTQEEFDKDHTEPSQYGEDGTMVVSANVYTEAQAKETIAKFLQVPEDDIDLVAGKVDYRIAPPGTSGAVENPNEPIYYLNADKSGIFDAWISQA